MHDAHRCYVAIGSNLAGSRGGSRETLAAAIEQMSSESVSVQVISPLYQTPAYPKGSGPDFLNGIVQILTILPPEAVLSTLHSIEKGLGRIRSARWEARVCDLDLLTYGQQILPDRPTQTEWRQLAAEEQMARTPDRLILPHPRLQDRSFVLIPLRDVDPDFVHPATGAHIDTMIGDLKAEDIDAMIRLD